MGIGRGNWIRLNRLTRVEECLCLNIRILHDQGLLQAGASSVQRWVKQGTEIASIHIACQVNNVSTSLILSYTLNRVYPKMQRIELQVTEPHFGGQRWWFTCPRTECQRRAEKLYHRHSHWACRKCHQLTYRSSQTAHAAARMRRYLLNHFCSLASNSQS